MPHCSQNSVPQDSDAREFEYGFLQNLQSFACQDICHRVKSSGVTTWPREAIDQAIRNWIGGRIREHDGDSLGGLLGGETVVWTTGNDEIDLETNQLISQSGEPLGSLFSGAKLERDVLSLDITELAQLSS